MNPLDQLPDFQSFKYQVALRPASSLLRAWDKLAECERRLEMYRFVEANNDPGKAQYRILLNDALSAFLLSLEATLQFVKDQCRRSKPALQFDKWLRQQSRYDVTLKGLRTLRHFEAHVLPTPPRSAIVATIGGSLPDGTLATGVSRTWHLPQLQPTDLDQLKKWGRPLAPADLNDWNTMAAKLDVKTILADGLTKLRDILLAAEQVI